MADPSNSEKNESGEYVKVLNLLNPLYENHLTTLTPYLTTLTDLTTLTTLTPLTTRDRVLIELIKKPKTITEISKGMDETGNSLSKVSLAIQWTERNTGLLPDGLVELCEINSKGVNVYGLTGQGVNHLIAIAEQAQRKKQIEQESIFKKTDLIEATKRFAEYIELHHHAELLENVRIGKNHLNIDFREFSKFDPEYADLLLDAPEDTIKVAETSLKEFDLPTDTKIRIRFVNLPESEQVSISELRGKHIGKFVGVEGVVKQQSDVRPQTISAKFGCPNCGNIISVLQIDTKFKEPTRCGCGRKGRFNLVSKELVDAQRIILEEMGSQVDYSKSKRIDVFLQNDLTSKDIEKKTLPGNVIKINGIVKELPILLKTGGQSIRFDLFIDANNIEAVEEKDITISDEDKKDFKEFTEKYDKKTINALADMFCPTIYGCSEFKQGILLGAVGGVKKARGLITLRGHINVMVIGEPGKGKSQLLKEASRLLPKSRYVCGTNTSAVGLTAAAVKDDFLRGWALEAGAMPLSKDGQCCIDEVDKFQNDEQEKLTEPLEQGTISISKATIQATIPCEVPVVIAGNPKDGKFKSDKFMEDLPDFVKTYFKDRMDLFYKIDVKENNEDKIVDHLISVYKGDKEDNDKNNTFLRKYIIYAKHNYSPKLTDAFLNKIKTFYIKMKEYCEVAGVYVSIRLFESLSRLGEASAKLRLNDSVDIHDAEIAIGLVTKSLKDFGVEVVEVEAIEDLIHLKCHVCGETPCIGFTPKGKPICKDCQRSVV